MTAIGGAFTKIGNKSAAGFLLCEDQCDDGDSAYEPIVSGSKRQFVALSIIYLYSKTCVCINIRCVAGFLL